MGATSTWKALISQRACRAGASIAVQLKVSDLDRELRSPCTPQAPFWSGYSLDLIGAGLNPLSHENVPRWYSGPRRFNDVDLRSRLTYSVRRAHAENPANGTLTDLRYA